MAGLPFKLDKELTVPDRMVLGILEKEYEAGIKVSVEEVADGEESDDSLSKHSKFVSPSPEGT